MDSDESALQSGVRAGVVSGEIVDGELFAPADGEALPAAWLRELLLGIEKGSVRGLRLRNVKIDGTLQLDHLQWSGSFELEGCTIHGDVVLSHATMQGRFSLVGSELACIDLSYARIQGSVAASDMVAHRGMYALGAEISGSLILRRALLRAPDGDGFENRAALDLYRTSIGDLYATSATIYGGVYAVGVKVSRGFRLSGSQIWSRRSIGLAQGREVGDGIEILGADIGGSLYLTSSKFGQAVIRGGSASLRNTTCRSLRVTVTQLNESWNFEGCLYDTVGPISGAEMLSHLDSQVVPPRRAYAILATFAESHGDSHLRRQALIHQQRRWIRAQPRASERLRGRMFDAIVGFGYLPSRAISWLFVTIAIAIAISRFSAPAIKSTEGQPLEESWPAAAAFAVGEILPVGAIGWRGTLYLQPSSSFEWVAYFSLIVLKILAWVLAALSLAAATGLVRRRAT